MSLHTVRMPDIGEGIAEVELVEWRVKAGDSVAEDQALADVMTDKATVEIPSPVTGRVLVLGGEVGQLLAVGAELIRIELHGTGDAVTAPAASVTPAPPSVAERSAPPPAASLLPRGPAPRPWHRPRRRARCGSARRRPPAPRLRRRRARARCRPPATGSRRSPCRSSRRRGSGPRRPCRPAARARRRARPRQCLRRCRAS